MDGEIIRIETDSVLVKPYSSHNLPQVGATAYHLGRNEIFPSLRWKGRVLNAFGEPLDDGPKDIAGETAQPVEASALPALQRARINKSLITGVRAIDLFTPLAFGQRMGIFAGSGVGKSTLLTMLARSNAFDIIVVGLIGERGREVREFLEEALKERRKDAIVIVATGDESALVRRLAARSATAVAEFFRDRGQNVLLIIDSITRYAQACREIGLAAGEPPVARGFPPSVFTELPQLLERAGPGVDGSGAITGLFSVLIDGDDHNDPVADSIRGTLDGHVVLDRNIAAQGRYPAIDILRSLSRLSHLGWTEPQRVLVQKLVAMASRFEDTRDLRAMGGYHPGSDQALDAAVALTPKLYEALKQGPSDPASVDAFAELADVMRSES
jgi:flagellum-specific ATP synthase